MDYKRLLTQVERTLEQIEATESTRFTIEQIGQTIATNFRDELGITGGRIYEINDENRTDVGVVFGSGAGGQLLMIESFVTLKERGANRVPPTFIANALVDSTSGMIAIETGAIGHNVAMVSARCCNR